MNQIDDNFLIERVNRLKKISDEVERITKTVSEGLIKISHLKKEADLIEKQLDEFVKEKSENSTGKI